MKFHAKNRYRTNCKAMSAISVFHSLNSFFSKVYFFPNTSCIFVFTLATILFARDSRQQHLFMNKCNSTLNTLFFDSKSDRGFTLRVTCIFSVYTRANTSYKWDIPWYYTRECYITILYHAMQNNNTGS